MLSFSRKPFMPCRVSWICSVAQYPLCLFTSSIQSSSRCLHFPLILSYFLLFSSISPLLLFYYSHLTSLSSFLSHRLFHHSLASFLHRFPSLLIRFCRCSQRCPSRCADPGRSAYCQQLPEPCLMIFIYSPLLALSCLLPWLTLHRFYLFFLTLFALLYLHLSMSFSSILFSSPLSIFTPFLYLFLFLLPSTSPISSLRTVDHHPFHGVLHGQEEVHQKRAQDWSLLCLAHVIRLGVSQSYDGTYVIKHLFV